MRMLQMLACALPLLIAATGTAPADPALVTAAEREGRVVVYSVLSNKAAAPLIEDFRELYPRIAVDYDGEKGSNDMDARFRAERAAGQPTADIVWSSSTDMQMKLVAEGYAATYRSPQAGGLPRWAIFRDQAYGTTLEPVVLAYNKELLPPEKVPQDHVSLIRALGTDSTFRGRVTGFDITKSGVGLMFLLQDRSRLGSLDRLLAAFSKADFAPSAGTGDMLVGINSGRFVLGYDIMGAYAISRSAKDLPKLGVVFPRDYTLLLTRVAFVSRKAAHPNAARLWLDYLLSPRGQKILGDAIELYPIRQDVEARFTASKLLAQLGPAAWPIRPDLSLVHALESPERRAVLRGWAAAMSRPAVAKQGR